MALTHSIYQQYTADEADRNMASHSRNNIDKIHELIDLDRYKLPNKDNKERKIEFESRCSLAIGGSDLYELHKDEVVYGNESIIKMRVEVDCYGGARQTADLKFQYVRDVHKWIETTGRTIGVHVRRVAVIGLLLAMLTTTCAAPAARSQPTRSTHHDDSVVSCFIYLPNKLRKNIQHSTFSIIYKAKNLF